MEELSRKIIIFDLHIEKLKKQYPSPSPTAWKQAWSQIKRFLEESGFEHTQYSGYFSKEPMETTETFLLLEHLQDKYPWFVECGHIDVGDLPTLHSFNDYYQKTSGKNTSQTAEIPERLSEIAKQSVQDAKGQTGHNKHDEPKR